MKGAERNLGVCLLDVFFEVCVRIVNCVCLSVAVTVNVQGLPQLLSTLMFEAGSHGAQGFHIQSCTLVHKPPSGLLHFWSSVLGCGYVSPCPAYGHLPCLHYRDHFTGVFYVKASNSVLTSGLFSAHIVPAMLLTEDSELFGNQLQAGMRQAGDFTAPRPFP